MTDLKKFTIASARKALKAKEISATELANASLDAIKASGLDVFATVTAELALSQAKMVDEGKAGGLLAGIPIGVKDVFCTKGVRTAAGSKMLENFVPPYESTATARLFQHGAIMAGKTICSEFGMGVSDASAAAVAGNLCLGLLGTGNDGCGVVGLKSTYSLCSRFGVISTASSLDAITPVGKTVEDVALLLQAIAGYDGNDAVSANRAVPDYAKAIGQPVKGMKIGVFKEHGGTIPAEAIAALKDAGCEIVEIPLLHAKYALAVYQAISMAEMSSNLARYDGVRFGQRVEGKTLDELYINSRSENFGLEVQHSLCLGTFILSAGGYRQYFEKAQKVRRLIADEFYGAF
ncbi:MAG: amidase family protein, partial [Alphaproteobacteria bacterium]|nr:amidase family protein [Alphaproteobacteria bacterium]